MFRWGGFPAVVVAKTLVLLLAFAVAYRACRRRGAGALASTLALAAAAFVGRERFVERPHVFSLLGEAVTLSVIGALEAGGAPARRAALWFLGAVVVWSNLHAGVFAAPLMLGGAALALAVTGERARRATDGARGGCVGAGDDGHARRRRLFSLPALAPAASGGSSRGRVSRAELVFRRAAVGLPGRAGGGHGPHAGHQSRAGAAGGRACARPRAAAGVAGGHAVRFGADAALLGASVLALAARGRWTGEEGAARRRWRRWRPSCCWWGSPSGPALPPEHHPPNAGGSGSTPGSCRWTRSRSSTKTACVSGCTTTSRSALTCCSTPSVAIRTTASSSIRVCPPIRWRCTGCSAAPTCRARRGARRWIATASRARF